MSHGTVTQDWPMTDLEWIGRCPICLSERRSILHEAVTDNAFGVAAGTWTIQRCLSCHSAYLDPRPTEASIHRAYVRYYTHKTAEENVEATPTNEPDRGRFASLKYRLGNGYRNWRYGTRFLDAQPVGAILGRVFPPLARASDELFRWLPNPRNTPAGRLLDIGCGNGLFLRLARIAGWSAFGCDPDPKARSAAEAMGAEVRDGGPDVWLDQVGQFDAVTMIHVIEHFHDPVAALDVAFLLLRRDGFLYIETPNIEAVGHEIYGANWRGLEAPRHIAIFSRRAMIDLLTRKGFRDIRFKRMSNVFATLCERSAKIEAGYLPSDSIHAEILRLPTFYEKARARASRKKVEYLAVVCRK